MNIEDLAKIIEAEDLTKHVDEDLVSDIAVLVCEYSPLFLVGELTNKATTPILTGITAGYMAGYLKGRENTKLASMLKDVNVGNS